MEIEESNGESPGLQDFFAQLEKALEIVKKFTPAEKVKAGHTWNSFSERLQTILNCSITPDNNAVPTAANNNAFDESIVEAETCFLSSQPCCTEVVMTSFDVSTSSEFDEGKNQIDDKTILPFNQHELLNEPSILCDLSNNVRISESNLGNTPTISSETEYTEIGLVVNNDIIDNKIDNSPSPTQCVYSGVALTNLSCDNFHQKCNKKSVDVEKPTKQIVKQDIKPFKCPDCDASFCKKGNLKAHQRKHSNEPNPFICTHCCKGFTSNSNLKRHLLTHEGIKPHRCTTCDARFTEKKSLMMHVKSLHHREKSFSCSVCDKKFAKSYVLQQHMGTHSKKKNHLCFECGKSFLQRSQLRMHEKRHSATKSNSCEYCDSNFFTKSELLRHQKSHSGDKPYECTKCDKQFTRQENLKEHQHRHLGLRLVCPHCQSSFSKQSALQKHVKEHEMPP